MREPREQKHALINEVIGETKSAGSIPISTNGRATGNTHLRKDTMRSADPPRMPK